MVSHDMNNTHTPGQKWYNQAVDNLVRAGYIKRNTAEVAAEAARKTTAEASRKPAEASRKPAEASRKPAEASRKPAEASRKSAEAGQKAAEYRRRALAIMFDQHPAWARSRVPPRMRASVSKTLADLEKECRSLARAIAGGKKNTNVPANLRPCVNRAVQKTRAGTNATTGKPRWIGPLNYLN
jgi:uncharacterized membrane protein YqiK